MRLLLLMGCVLGLSGCATIGPPCAGRLVPVNATPLTSASRQRRALPPLLPPQSLSPEASLPPASLPPASSIQPSPAISVESEP